MMKVAVQERHRVSLRPSHDLIVEATPKGKSWIICHLVMLESYMPVKSI